MKKENKNKELLKISEDLSLDEIEVLISVANSFISAKKQNLEELKKERALQELIDILDTDDYTLENIQQINGLDLSLKDLKKIPEGIKYLSNLEDLSFYSNRISKIEGLDKLVNLKRLILECNEISKIEGLDNLVNLKVLDLSENDISKIEGLDKLVNLEDLFLSGNDASKIEGLDNLANLTYFDLRDD